MIKDTSGLIRESPAEFTVRLFSAFTVPPPEEVLQAVSLLYMSGFNEPPWDIYDWRFTPERVGTEVAVLVSTMLDSGGALVSLLQGDKPVGFSIVSSLDVFTRKPEKVPGPGELPENYRDPGEYFQTLSHLLQIDSDEFKTIGYIADIAVDAGYRGKGLSKLLLSSSIGYLKDRGKRGALAWTVNPVMAGTLSRMGFAVVSGIGLKGEGIDFTLYRGKWHPVVVLPAESEKKQENRVVAQHFLKVF